MTSSVTLAELWAETKFDERDLVELCGLPPGIGLVAFRRAKGNRLIYPDGSVHQLAKLAIQAIMKKAMS